MLGTGPSFPLLAFGIPGIAPDEHSPSKQLNDRSYMNSTKKSDAKNHLSLQNRHGIHLYRPGSQPVPTDFSDGKSERTNSDTNNSDGTPLNQSSSSLPIQPEPDPRPVSSQAELKSAQE
jgi:hypothetical protein